MLSFFRRLFKKNTKRDNTTDLLADLVAIRELWDKFTFKYYTRSEPQNETLLDQSRVANNPLVPIDILNKKLIELEVSAQKLNFFLGEYETHLRCLHNWLTTPPPGPKVEVEYETEPKIADSDQEYLDMLEKARRAQNEAR